MAGRKKDNKKHAEENAVVGSDNVIRFRRDPELLEEIADDMLDEDDVRGALRLLLEVEKSGDHDYALYRKIADIYTELEMFPRSINYWFKFLDAAPTRSKAEAYNGFRFYILLWLQYATIFIEKFLYWSL